MDRYAVAPRHGRARDLRGQRRGRGIVVLARAPPRGKSPPRLDARPPTSVHVPMPAPTTLSELIALYLARCRIEGLSPRTQRAYSETLARFQRSVAAQGVPDEAAAVETATVILWGTNIPSAVKQPTVDVM